MVPGGDVRARAGTSAPREIHTGPVTGRRLVLAARYMDACRLVELSKWAARPGPARAR
jgi:hypothetical protein